MPCSNPNDVLIFTLLLMSFCYVALVIYQSNRSGSVATMKILFFFVSTARVFLPAARRWLGLLGVFDFDPSDTFSSCVMPVTPYQTLSLQAWSPLLFYGILICIWFCHWLINKCRKLPFSKNRYVAPAIAMLIFSYTSVTTAVIRYLQCVDVGDSTVVLTAPAIDCNNEKYKTWLTMVYFLLIGVVILFPVLVLILLGIAHRRHWFKKHWFQNTWGVLFKTYRDKLWWWQFVALIRRTILVLLSFTFWDSEFDLSKAFSVFSLVILLAHLKMQPFKRGGDNQRETISLCVLCLVSAVSAHNNGEVIPLFTQILLVVLIFLTFTVFLVILLRDLIKAFKKRFGCNKAANQTTYVSPVVSVRSGIKF